MKVIFPSNVIFHIIDFEKFEENALGGKGKSRELYFQTNISFTSIAKISDLSSLSRLEIDPLGKSHGQCCR